MESRKYYVKHNYRFNLDSMRTSMLCIRDDMRDGVIDGPVEVMGKQMTEAAVDAFIAEIEDLIYKAYGPVTGKEYGRIKAISDARNAMRYAKCIAAGMSENDAALAFFD